MAFTLGAQRLEAHRWSGRSTRSICQARGGTGARRPASARFAFDEAHTRRNGNRLACRRPVTVAMMASALSVRSFVKAALEASVYVAPEDPWLTKEEVAAASSRAGFDPAETAKTLEDLFFAGECSGRGDRYLPTEKGLSPFLPDCAVPFIPDLRNTSALSFLFRTFQEEAKTVGKSWTHFGKEQLVYLGAGELELSRRDVLMAINLLQAVGWLKYQDEVLRPSDDLLDRSVPPLVAGTPKDRTDLRAALEAVEGVTRDRESAIRWEALRGSLLGLPADTVHVGLRREALDLVLLAFADDGKPVEIEEIALKFPEEAGVRDILAYDLVESGYLKLQDAAVVPKPLALMSAIDSYRGVLLALDMLLKHGRSRYESRVTEEEVGVLTFINRLTVVEQRQMSSLLFDLSPHITPSAIEGRRARKLRYTHQLRLIDGLARCMTKRIPLQLTTGSKAGATVGAESTGARNPKIREGADFPATVVFILVQDLIDCTDGPMIPDALSALNAALRGVDASAFVLSTIAGVIIVIPDAARWTLEETFASLDRAKTGFSLRVGVTHGNVDVVTDIDGEENLVGTPINIAARVATSSENTGTLIHESYAKYVDPTLPLSHWLHRSVRQPIPVTGKPQDPVFECFVGPYTFGKRSLESQGVHRFRSAVIVAYDLPKFSAGDRAQLRKRFTRLASVFKKLWQLSPMPSETALLSPGGDGGVIVLPGLPLAEAASIASRLRGLTEIESIDSSDTTAVATRIGVHYGQITDYVNARGVVRPTGLDIFLADGIAGDAHARGKDDIIITRLVADSWVAGSNARLASEFEQLPPMASGPAAGVERFVRLSGAPSIPEPGPVLPPPTGGANDASSHGAQTANTTFEATKVSMTSKQRRTAGAVVAPTKWKISAVPVSSRGATKSQLHRAMTGATITGDGGTGRVTRWPRVLRPESAKAETRPDGTQILHCINNTGVANVLDEEQLGQQSDGTIWFQRAYFWDADEVHVDFGRCSFDAIVFLKMLVSIGNALDVNRYDVTLAIETPRPNIVVTIQTNGLAARQPTKTAKASGRFYESAVRVTPKTALPDTVLAGLSHRLLDGIANEFELSGDMFYEGDSGPSFLEIDEAAIASVLSGLK